MIDRPVVGAEIAAGGDSGVEPDQVGLCGWVDRGEQEQQRPRQLKVEAVVGRLYFSKSGDEGRPRLELSDGEEGTVPGQATDRSLPRCVFSRAQGTFSAVLLDLEDGCRTFADVREFWS